VKVRINDAAIVQSKMVPDLFFAKMVPPKTVPDLFFGVAICTRSNALGEIVHGIKRVSLA